MPKKIFVLFRTQLLLQVGFAIICGVLIGEFWPSVAINLNFISIIFINLIKLIICPLIFVSVVLGICQHQHAKGLYSLAARSLIYFEIMAVIAILLSLAFMLWLQPGAQFDINQVHHSDISKYINSTNTADLEHGWKNFIIDIFPDSILGVLSGYNLIPVIVLAVFISLAVLRMTETRISLLKGFTTVNELLFNLINIIVRLSPLAAFGAIASAVGEQGVKILIPLGGLILTILLIMLIFCALLTIIAFFYGINTWKLMRHIREELVVAFGTSSSEAVFPQLMKKLESFGCSKSVVGFVLPTGYSFNLDGTAIYVVAGALFIQQAYGIPFTIYEFFLLIGIILVTSKGAAGVTGAGFVTLAATLSALPGNLIPIEGLAILLGIDRFMSDARTMCNLFGNSVGTVIIAKAQGEYTPQV